MKQRFLLVLSSMALALLAWGAGSALAHHSVSATYIFGKTVRLDGTLKEFIWRNPHSFMRVEAPDDKGHEGHLDHRRRGTQPTQRSRIDGEHSASWRSCHRDGAARTYRRGPQAPAAHNRASIRRVPVRGAQ